MYVRLADARKVSGGGYVEVAKDQILLLRSVKEILR
jgi:hypothetical protein